VLTHLRQLSRASLVGLARILREGRLTQQGGRASLKSLIPEQLDPKAILELEGLLSEGMTAIHLALLLEEIALAKATVQAVEDRVNLVWSGPDATSQARDTRVVIQEMFREAKEHVLIATYAIDKGEKAKSLFQSLAAKLDNQPGFHVEVFLNIQRSLSDDRPDRILVHEFHREFQDKIWPGKNQPSVYFDPRSLRLGPERACLHAKCVVADRKRLVVSSANFTEAAQDRNLELGIILEEERTAKLVEHQFRNLLAQGVFRPLL